MKNAFLKVFFCTDRATALSIVFTLGLSKTEILMLYHLNIDFMAEM